MLFLSPGFLSLPDILYTKHDRKWLLFCGFFLQSRLCRSIPLYRREKMWYPYPQLKACRNQTHSADVSQGMYCCSSVSALMFEGTENTYMKRMVIAIPQLNEKHRHAICEAAEREGYETLFFETPGDALDAVRDAEILFTGFPELPKRLRICAGCACRRQAYIPISFPARLPRRM